MSGVTNPAARRGPGTPGPKGGQLGKKTMSLDDDFLDDDFDGAERGMGGQRGGGSGRGGPAAGFGGPPPSRAHNARAGLKATPRAGSQISGNSSYGPQDSARAGGGGGRGTSPPRRKPPAGKGKGGKGTPPQRRNF